MAVCDTDKAHLDLALAKELKQMDVEDGESSTNKKAGDYLVLHLSDLVRMGFMGMILISNYNWVLLLTENFFRNELCLTYIC